MLAFCYALPLAGIFEFSRRSQDLLLGQDPSAPVHAERTLTLCIGKDVDGVLGIGMDIAEHPAGLVSADRDQAEIKGPAVFSDLGKCRAGGQVCVGGGVVVFGLGDAFGHGAVARVAGGEGC